MLRRPNITLSNKILEVMKAKIGLSSVLLQNCNNIVLRAFMSQDANSSKEWRRIPWSQREEQWDTKFKLFAPEKGMGPDLVRFLRSPLNLSLAAIKRWVKRKELQHEIMNQRFIPQRHEILGNDLAAAHFITYRGGSVRFCGAKDWLNREDGEKQLPRTYSPDYKVEALSAAGTKLRYEGLQNFIGLDCLKWLSLSNCPHIDNWCMDYVSGEFCHTLEYLDISNCPNITENGLSALYRLQNLRTLNVLSTCRSKSFELSCLLLEDAIPGLRIEGVKYISA